MACACRDRHVRLLPALGTDGVLRMLSMMSRYPCPIGAWAWEGGGALGPYHLRFPSQEAHGFSHFVLEGKVFPSLLGEVEILSCEPVPGNFGRNGMLPEPGV